MRVAEDFVSAVKLGETKEASALFDGLALFVFSSATDRCTHSFECSSGKASATSRSSSPGRAPGLASSICTSTSPESTSPTRCVELDRTAAEPVEPEPRPEKQARGKAAEDPTPEELEAACEEEELLAVHDSVEDDFYDGMDPGVRERMLFAAGCLELGWKKWRVKDGLQTQFAGISRKTAERDVGRARARLRDSQRVSKADLREELAMFYRAKMTDKEIETREQLRAAKQFVELLGLKDQSGYDPPKEDIIIELDEEWRSYYSSRLDEGKVLTANAPVGRGVKLAKEPVATNCNGAVGNGTG
jgi:hypothetical protein